MEYLSGIVERITYSNEENGFSVIKFKSKGFGDLVTVVGSLAAVNVGATIKLKGDWKQDSKFGKQFSVVDYRETVPATIAGTENSVSHPIPMIAPSCLATSIRVKLIFSLSTLEWKKTIDK